MSPENARPDLEVPLAADLDGTLIRSDLLWESFAAALARRPWLALAIPFWLLGGRADLKERLARAGAVDSAALPYRDEVVAFLRAEHARGRRIVIATAAHESLALEVARHLGFVERVIATTPGSNLKGEAKRAALVAAFGERGYDYVGDSAADLPAMRSARVAHAAGDAALAASVRARGNAGIAFPASRERLAPLARALRLHQWPKNLLVFVPVVTAHRANDAAALLHASLAFAAFSLAASAIYLVNDWVDLAFDRRHDAKRLRPFASGRLPLAWAAWLVPLLLAASAALALGLPGEFQAALGAYVAATFAYSLLLKRLPIADVLALAGLYTLRIFAGAAAIGVPLSHWLLGFSLLLFLSLALIKRFVELAAVLASGPPGAAVAGRGYRSSDLAPVGWLGAISGYLAVLVFAVFITSADTIAQYRHPAVLWVAPLLLFAWITRAWLLARARRLDRDPVVFALTDPPSYAVLAALLAAVWLAV